MNLIDYIRVYDDVLNKKTLDVFLKLCEENHNFKDAGLASKENGNRINKKIRDEKNGKYTFHVDHGLYSPRTFSCIFLCNSNYEGGELCFKFLGTEKAFTIEKKSNRMIVWPSNFLYPHAVKPVTKGIRYSVVSWAL